jgi:hypothetical protein
MSSNELLNAYFIKSELRKTKNGAYAKNKNTLSTISSIQSLPPLHHIKIKEMRKNNESKKVFCLQYVFVLLCTSI